MKDVIKLFEGLPFIVKLILCIPVVNVVWQIYKICKSAVKNNTLGVILGVLCIVPGAVFIWAIDLVTLLLNGKRVWWID